MVVCGLGATGFHIVEELVDLGETVVAIERDAENRFIEQARALNIHGRAQRREAEQNFEQGPLLICGCSRADHSFHGLRHAINKRLCASLPRRHRLPRGSNHAHLAALSMLHKIWWYYW
jgi:voltage-gated potassium channel Kch